MDTAVEWFYDKIKSHFEHDGDLLETLTFTKAIAKLKEREQHSNTWNDGMKSDNGHFGTFEDYYNETFKTKYDENTNEKIKQQGGKRN